MKYKIITSLACLFFFFLADSQQPVLTAKSIVQKFVSTYDIHTLPYHRVEFEKRMTSWYVKTISVVNGEIKRSTPLLFYNSEANEFVPLAFQRQPPGETNNPDELMPEPESYNFDIQPYYGYEGWYKDVIKVYGSRKDLNELELYALARAYSSQAIEPVTGQGSFAVPADRFKMPLQREAFSAQQLKIFTTSVDSSISKYRQLSIRNPQFQTRVGDSRDKYANEVMFKFHILLAFSGKGLSEMVLPENLYKDSTLEVARKYLNACPQQAIFLSFGDNDFYPLYYLQQAEGLRKDVYVINYNLLAVDKFIHRLTYPQFNSRPVSLSADTSMYKSTTNELIYLRHTSAVITIADLLRFLRNGEVDTDGRKILNASTIELPWKKDKISTKISLSLAENYYLYKNHWILFDIINNLDGRALCFANQFSDELKGLNQFLSFNKDGQFFSYNN